MDVLMLKCFQLTYFGNVHSEAVSNTPLLMHKRWWHFLKINRTMIFGIYPGSVAGTETDLAKGKPDVPPLILKALSELQNSKKSLIVRGYIHYLGQGKLANEAPENIEQYIADNRKLDLVLCYRADKFNEEDWKDSIKKVIERYGDKLYSLQITEEPNLKVAFAGDGSFENIEKALLSGVLTAKAELERLQLSTKIGFNVVPSFNPSDNFWNIIGSNEFEAFRKALDFVGLDFFPDVFRAVAPDGQPNDLKQSVINVLRYFRNTNLQTGNIPFSVPIHITENGWATGNERTYERQAFVIEKIIRTINEIKIELNITQYELFGLRDVDTANQSMFCQFGLLKDDYSAKPAFDTYCKLINELS
jgi:hypothetical protein